MGEGRRGEGGGTDCGDCGAGRGGGVDVFWRSFLAGELGVGFSRWGSQGGDEGGGEGAGGGVRYLRWGEAEGEAEGDGLEVGWALRRGYEGIWGQSGLVRCVAYRCLLSNRDIS